MDPIDVQPLPSLELPDDADEARSVLQAYIATYNVGVLLSLGGDGDAGFALGSAMTNSVPGIGVVALWAKNPSFIQSIVEGLQNGSQVNFGPNGHRLVSINKLDQVSRVLSLFESKSKTSVLGAFWCAARSDKACDF